MTPRARDEPRRPPEEPEVDTSGGNQRSRCRRRRPGEVQHFRKVGSGGRPAAGVRPLYVGHGDTCPHATSLGATFRFHSVSGSYWRIGGRRTGRAHFRHRGSVRVSAGELHTRCRCSTGCCRTPQPWRVASGGLQRACIGWHPTRGDQPSTSCSIRPAIDACRSSTMRSSIQVSA